MRETVHTHLQNRGFTSWQIRGWPWGCRPGSSRSWWAVVVVAAVMPPPSQSTNDTGGTLPSGSTEDNTPVTPVSRRAATGMMPAGDEGRLLVKTSSPVTATRLRSSSKPMAPCATAPPQSLSSATTPRQAWAPCPGSPRSPTSLQACKPATSTAHSWPSPPAAARTPSPSPKAATPSSSAATPPLSPH
jgi:hypothetical protein